MTDGKHNTEFLTLNSGFPIVRRVEIPIAPEDDGRTVKSVLKRFGVSTRLSARLKRTPGGILLSGREAWAADAVRAGDVLALAIPEEQPPAKPGALSVPVLYEDDDLIAFDKPPHMPVHPVKDHQTDTLAGAFAAHLAESGLALPFRPVGRLDMDTSGIVLAAKNALAASKCAGNARKRYLCLCAGVLPESGTVDAPLGTMDGHAVQQQAREDGRPAVTHYRRVSSADGFSLAEVWMDTGRMHQIRAHFAHIGHPLLGDWMYGETCDGIDRHALHCAALEVAQPVTGALIALRAPLPEDMRALALKLGLIDENTKF